MVTVMVLCCGTLDETFAFISHIRRLVFDSVSFLCTGIFPCDHRACSKEVSPEGCVVTLLQCKSILKLIFPAAMTFLFF